MEFCQDNESMSSYGVMRGLHFQRPPFTQSKLVRCVKGRVIIIPSFLTLKEGSTFLTKPLFNNLYAPFGSPSSGGQKPSGTRGCNHPSGARNRFALRLADQSKVYVMVVRDGISQMMQIFLQLIYHPSRFTGRNRVSY